MKHGTFTLPIAETKDATLFGDNDIVMEKLKTAIQKLDLQNQIEWMIDLGYQLTVYARGAYPVGDESGNLNQLLGFNELQHQIYGRIRTLRRGEIWTIESFIQSLSEKAECYGILRDLKAAFNASRNSVPTSERVQ